MLPQVLPAKVISKLQNLELFLLVYETAFRKVHCRMSSEFVNGRIYENS